jgi:hypothetical protein
MLQTLFRPFPPSLKEKEYRKWHMTLWEELSKNPTFKKNQTDTIKEFKNKYSITNIINDCFACMYAEIAKHNYKYKFRDESRCKFCPIDWNIPSGNKYCDLDMNYLKCCHIETVYFKWSTSIDQPDLRRKYAKEIMNLW